MKLALGPVDPARDIETLNEELESDFVGESECDGSEQQLSFAYDADTSIPGLNQLDSGSEDYRFSTGNFFYLIHFLSFIHDFNELFTYLI